MICTAGCARCRPLPATPTICAARGRKTAARVALVDAGDMFQGTLESNLTEGASVIAAYRVLGMTVATLGNHEFDFGPVGDAVGDDPQGAIRARISEASFPDLVGELGDARQPRLAGLGQASALGDRAGRRRPRRLRRPA